MYIIFYVYNVVSATTIIVIVGLHLRIAHHFHSVVVSVRLSACNEASNAVQVVQLVGVGTMLQEKINKNVKFIKTNSNLPAARHKPVT